jgi:hypothetical protein
MNVAPGSKPAQLNLDNQGILPAPEVFANIWLRCYFALSGMSVFGVSVFGNYLPPKWDPGPLLAAKICWQHSICAAVHRIIGTTDGPAC